jgi:hypothetical protein
VKTDPPAAGTPRPANGPRDQGVRDLLREMREGRRHSHRGGRVRYTAGLVTLEDLLARSARSRREGIPTWRWRGSGPWRGIRELSEALGLELDNPEVDTVPFSCPARAHPKPGDTVRPGRVNRGAADRRIYRVL